jgi:hypothetical protein
VANLSKRPVSLGASQLVSDSCSKQRFGGGQLGPGRTTNKCLVTHNIARRQVDNGLKHRLEVSGIQDPLEPLVDRRVLLDPRHYPPFQVPPCPSCEQRMHRYAPRMRGYSTGRPPVTSTRAPAI